MELDEKTCDLVEWYLKQIEYPISKKIRDEFKKTNYIELIYSKNKNAFKIRISNNLLQLKEDELLIFNLFVDKDYDEPTDFIKSKLNEYYLTKKIDTNWFKLDIADVNDIIELLYLIEGEDVIDNLDDIKKILNPT